MVVEKPGGTLTCNCVPGKGAESQLTRPQKITEKLGLKPRPSRTALNFIRVVLIFYIQHDKINAGI